MYCSQSLCRHRGLKKEEEGLAGWGLTPTKLSVQWGDTLGHFWALDHSWSITSALITGKETKSQHENQYAQERFILITDTWEVVWRNKLSHFRLGGKALSFPPPINKMIAVNKTNPQQLLTLKPAGLLHLHQCAKTTLPIKYNNIFLRLGTTARTKAY